MTRTERPNRLAPAFYVARGGTARDLITLLHPPYTAWHLGYVAIGAAAAPDLDGARLAGTLLAFFAGTGVAAHALDEWHDRPLRTGLSARTLRVLGFGGLAVAGALALAGAAIISPWLLAWGALGVVLVLVYSLEWSRRVHSDAGFALAWGGFPVLVGYWAQAEAITPAAVLIALAATALSFAQRGLSTPARYLRRSTLDASTELQVPGGVERWEREHLLATWERPLLAMALGVVALAAGLLLAR
ncbi:MAG: hypothetical protein GEU80_11745 [Dehalococcoidia bacterium]|nr:hypothetical protein [Dehalococcoidia bacterium]